MGRKKGQWCCCGVSIRQQGSVEWFMRHLPHAVQLWWVAFAMLVCSNECGVQSWLKSDGLLFVLLLSMILSIFISANGGGTLTGLFTTLSDLFGKKSSLSEIQYLKLLPFKDGVKSVSCMTVYSVSVDFFPVLLHVIQFLYSGWTYCWFKRIHPKS